MKSYTLYSLMFILLSILFFAPKAIANGMRFKREIFIQNGPDNMKNAVIEILLEKDKFDYSNVKPDGADIRFSLDDNLKGHGLSYWIEQWNIDGRTIIWLRIPILKPKETLKVIMYYGDERAFPVSSGKDTFLFFDDFDGNDFSKKWSNTSVGEVVQRGGVLKLKESDGQDGIVTAKFKVKGKMIIRTNYQRENADEHWTRAGIGGWNYYICFGDHTELAGTGTNYVMMYEAASLLSLETIPLVKAANGKINNKWHRSSLSYDGNSLRGVQDDVSVEWPASKASSKLSLRVLDNDAWDNFAYVSVSPFSAIEPKVSIGEHQINL